jgi:hypothetical protein
MREWYTVTRNESVVAYFKTTVWNSPAEIEENHEELGRDLNWVPAVVMERVSSRFPVQEPRDWITEPSRRIRWDDYDKMFKKSFGTLTSDLVEKHFVLGHTIPFPINSSKPTLYVIILSRYLTPNNFYTWYSELK